MKTNIFLFLNILCFGTQMVFFGSFMYNRNTELKKMLLDTRDTETLTHGCRGSESKTGCLCFWFLKEQEEEDKKLNEKQPPQKKDVLADPCEKCRENINTMMVNYSQPWQKQEKNFKELRSGLSSECNGYEKAIITQKNTPVGTTLVYDGEKSRKVVVNSEHFNSFIKENPTFLKTWKSCSVVGNGGILANSNCGEKIDSAEFVIRCNLSPLTYKYRQHVGTKTSLVTANPSQFRESYGSLMGRRRHFVENMCQYGNATLLLPAYSYSVNTALCQRVVYTLEEAESDIQPVYFSPTYIDSVATFWSFRDLKGKRLSTGFIMINLALELCEEVNVYGFWPFSQHPYTFETITNHYYNNVPPKKNVHSMPDEFSALLHLHSKGVLKLHLGECKPN